jgi:hypothetical protein
MTRIRYEYDSSPSSRSDSIDSILSKYKSRTISRKPSRKTTSSLASSKAFSNNSLFLNSSEAFSSKRHSTRTNSSRSSTSGYSLKSNLSGISELQRKYGTHSSQESLEVKHITSKILQKMKKGAITNDQIGHVIDRLKAYKSQKKDPPKKFVDSVQKMFGIKKTSIYD